MDTQTKETLKEFFGDLSYDEVVNELINLLPYNSVIDILEQMSVFKEEE